ncbi:CIA30 family protein [Shewanella sp. 0m-8]
MTNQQMPCYLSVINELQTPNWTLINDTVMGGISNSQIEIISDIATFSGQLSLERNGGFASTRAEISVTIPEGLDLIRLNVKGDGRRYQLRLRTDKQWDSFAYSSAFKTEKNKWLTIEFKADDFESVYRGRVVNAPKLSFGDIKQVGFLLADKQAGSFELSFKSIELSTSK